MSRFALRLGFRFEHDRNGYTRAPSDAWDAQLRRLVHNTAPAPGNESAAPMGMVDRGSAGSLLAYEDEHCK